MHQHRRLLRLGRLRAASSSSELKAIGIKITPSNLSGTTYDNDVYTGKYQLAYDGNEAGGPAPYYELRQELYSKNSAPIGKPASSNWERYYNKKVDKLINQYAATTSSAKQHSIVNQLEAAMVRDLPIIPITEGVDWYQYNTKSITGWVTPKQPVREAGCLRGARLGCHAPPPEAEG